MSICVVDGKHCQCGPSEGSPCPGVVELQAKLTVPDRQRTTSRRTGHRARRYGMEPLWQSIAVVTKKI
jgi:hypothetical protein